jgi:hypothetical protein
MFVMSQGRLSDAQSRAIRPYIVGRKVHDLGAGDMKLSGILVDLGALEVIAIDKQIQTIQSNPRIKPILSYFDHYKDPIDVAFVSWPMNFEGTGIVPLIKRADTIIYLGKNTDGNSCGSSELFSYTKRLKLLSYIPDSSNTLIICSNLFVSRPITGEEFAGIQMVVDSYKIWGYEEAELAAKNLGFSDR